MNDAITQEHAEHDEQSYLLGTDEQELVRLGLQHRLWAESALKLWERAKIQPGMRVLDVGCGPGYASFDLAQIAGPTGCVFGIDTSRAFVDFVRSQAQRRGMPWVDAAVGDAMDLSPALDGHEPFDLAWIRWVLCFLPDPEPAIAGMASALRPGGRLVIQDYLGYEALRLSPHRPAFAHGIRTIVRSWEISGGDLDVMGIVPTICRRVGLTVEHLGVTQRIARPGSMMWAWPTSFWASFIPRLVAQGLLSEAESAAFFDDWREATNDPDSFLHLPPVYEVVATKTD